MKVVFINKSGEKHEVEFTPGQTLLSVAEKNGIRINSMCEGNGVCGGCHVIIKDSSKISGISNKEEDGLDMARNVTPHSRLACQVILSEESNDLEVFLI